jgi:ribosome assembly protein 1
MSRMTLHWTYSLRAQLAQTRRETASQHDAEPLSIDFSHHVETGFQLAVAHGPLCAEPVEGMAYFFESLDIDTEGLQKETCMILRYIGTMSGSYLRL